MESATLLSSKEKKQKQELLAMQDFLKVYAPGVDVIPVKIPESNKKQLPDFLVKELGLIVEIKDAANKNQRKRESAWGMTCSNLTSRLNAALLGVGITDKYLVCLQHAVIPVKFHSLIIDRVLDAINKSNREISILLSDNQYNLRSHITIIKLNNEVNKSIFETSLSSFGAFGASSFVQNLFFREANKQGIRDDSSIDSANKQLGYAPDTLSSPTRILLVTVCSREYILPLSASEVSEAFTQNQHILLRCENIDEIWIRTDYYGAVELYQVWKR